jgi:hypothetical protein
MAGAYNYGIEKRAPHTCDGGCLCWRRRLERGSSRGRGQRSPTNAMVSGTASTRTSTHEGDLSVQILQHTAVVSDVTVTSTRTFLQEGGWSGVRRGTGTATGCA